MKKLLTILLLISVNTFAHMNNNQYKAVINNRSDTVIIYYPLNEIDSTINIDTTPPPSQKLYVEGYINISIPTSTIINKFRIREFEYEANAAKYYLIRKQDY